MSKSTAFEDNLKTIGSGTLDSRIFLCVAIPVFFYLVFIHDWSPLERIRIQSPITFVSDQQPGLSLASIAGGAKPDTLRIATSGAFDLGAVAKAEGIELAQEDIDLDDPRQQYIRKYSAVAVAEMKKFGVPASITIAQGLLETKAGQSSLATKNNNHFGMKCFSRNCKRGHCSNFTDDTHKDFFVKYASAWASFRAHSKLVTTGRYAHLPSLGLDYNAWAKGLKKAGYATAPHYAESLIKLIRLYGLDRLDRL